MNRLQGLVVAASIALPVVAAAGGEPQTTADAIRHTIVRIQRADYEGDRAALRTLHDALTPGAALEDRRITSRIHYWRGFALWRRAFNGFSDTPVPEDLAGDLEAAVREFDEALRRDAAFVDAKIGIISCMQALAALSRADPERVQGLVGRFMRLFKESLAEAPDNPRLLWVYGAQQWYTASQGRGTQEEARATYRKGLELARQQKARGADPLEPAWGEPELLMSLAWSSLNQPAADARAAEEYAQQALELVPHWHYVRDVLMPRIRAAKEKRIR